MPLFPSSGAWVSTGAEDVLDCVMSNPVEVFSYDASKWSTSDAILATLNDMSQWNATLTGQGFTLDQARPLQAADSSFMQVINFVVAFYILAWEAQRLLRCPRQKRILFRVGMQLHLFCHRI